MIAAPAALLLAVLHVVAGRLGRFRSVPRSRALSIGSGISVAYVFVHLLPEVAATQRELAEVATRMTTWSAGSGPSATRLTTG